MEEKDYLETRLDDQILWYDQKSILNQTWYKRLQLAEIIAAASIPLLAGYLDLHEELIRVIIGLLGLFIVVITGLKALFKYQENWIEYRTTCETLRHEKYLYLTLSGPYQTKHPFQLLVERVENLISRENSVWKECLKDKKGQELTN